MNPTATRHGMRRMNLTTVRGVAWLEVYADGEAKFQLQVFRTRGEPGPRTIRNPTVISLPTRSPMFTLLAMTTVITRKIDVIIDEDGSVLSIRLVMMGGPT